MAELARPVGLGLAATGKVSDVVRWADQARQKGVHAVWVHDTPYQRDAITYATAIAMSVPQIPTWYTRTTGLVIRFPPIAMNLRLRFRRSSFLS